MIKATKYILFMLLMAVGVTSCDNSETYGDRKKKERNAIAKFISQENIHVIDEATFKANGNKTDVDKNEYVYLQDYGIYMQIEDEGCGVNLLDIPDNQQMGIICRCVEYDIEREVISLRSDVLTYYADEMSVYHNDNEITASFTATGGAMFQSYGAAVPKGWITPLYYIKVGRPSKPGENIAYVRLIVPHTQGHQTATGSVLPYHYELTYQKK